MQDCKHHHGIRFPAKYDLLGKRLMKENRKGREVIASMAEGIVTNQIVAGGKEPLLDLESDTRARNADQAGKNLLEIAQSGCG